MKKKITWLVLGVVVLMVTPLAFGQNNDTETRGALVPLPQEFSGRSLPDLFREEKMRLHRYVKEKKGGDGDIVIFSDSNGEAILPDLERTKQRPKPSRRRNDITFVFDTSWSSEEVATLQATADYCYPAIRAVYGNPAFDITVTVSKDPQIGFAGFYYTSLNLMVLREASPADVFCHEMVHAFHDDFIIGLPSLEEGMARTVEVLVMSASPYADEYWNTNHSYPDDVYCEALKQDVIGSQGGNIFAGFAAPLVRYELASCSLTKMLVENSRFFVRFNQEFYIAASMDPTVPYSEEKILAIFARIQPKVERMPFFCWWEEQGVFDTVPPRGCFLYPRSRGTVYLFCRDDAGRETMQGGVDISWAVHDDQDNLLANGVAATLPLGWVSIPYYTFLSPDYRGRIDVVASGTAVVGGVGIPFENDTSWYVGSETGTFGIVTGVDEGTVTMTPLGKRGATGITAQVVQGAFQLPDVTDRGKYDIQLRNPDGKLLWRRTLDKIGNNTFVPIFLDRNQSSVTPSSSCLG